MELTFRFLISFSVFPLSAEIRNAMKTNGGGSFVLSSLVFVPPVFHALELSLFGVLFMVNNRTAVCGI